MSTRFNAHKKSTSRFGVPPLRTGFDVPSSPTDFTIPAVGIEDIDRALFDLFNNDIPLVVNSSNGTKKVPVIYASGERWAALRKGAPRDKNGSLIIPVIVMNRTTITQDPGADVTGRGINQSTGIIEVKRRINVTNRDLQNMINRTLIKNQANVALDDEDELLSDQVSTDGEIGDLTDDPTVQDGGLLLSDRKKSVFETVVFPQPQFFTATYEVTVWCQYIQQMNEIIQCLITSFLPQGTSWRIDTKQGYWFVASVDGNVYNAQNNFDDMSTEERTIKYQFTVTVPAYMFASDRPGQPVPVRRFISNPSVSFSISTNDSEQQQNVGGVVDPFLGADDPTLPLALKTSRRDQRDTNDTKLYKPGIDDPALSTLSRRRNQSTYRTITGTNSKGEKIKKHIKVKNTNVHTGETIYSNSFDLDGLSTIVMDDE